MLRTNSKQAHFNLSHYILWYFIPDNYDDAPQPKGRDGQYADSQFHEVALYVFKTFMTETKGSRLPITDRFHEWAQGLPSIIDLCYHYNRSAVKDVAEILEETPEEADKYTEDKAASLLDTMILHALVKEVDRATRPSERT